MHRSVRVKHAKAHSCPNSPFHLLKPKSRRGKHWGKSATSALVRLERTAAADGTVGSGAEVGIDIVDEWGDVGIFGKALHDGTSCGAAHKYGCPEFLNGHRRFDEGRARTAAHAVGPMITP